jgi:AAHS family 4-hydroxybenzoate transporter-like MFS transporter
MSRSIARTIEIRAVLNRPELGAFRRRVLLLCWTIAVLDGFDVQAMAFVAPVLGQAWQVPKPVMGWVLTAGLVGLMLGSIGLGRLSDKVGRRPVLLGSVVLFGVASLLTALSHSELQLMLMRCITGIGLGGVTVSALALMAEYAPDRSRASLVTAMYVGFPIGGSIAGLLATPLISTFGWQSVFIVGGVAPLLFIALIWRVLPESLQFNVMRGVPREQIEAVVVKIAPDHVPQPDDRFVIEEQRVGNASAAELFAPGRLSSTLLLWVISFANLLVLYALINWLPSILHQAGFSLAAANVGAVAFNLGGVAGALMLSRVVDRLGAFKVLAVAYALAAAVSFTLAHAGNASLAFALTLLAGAGVIGCQFCINALASVIYPTPVRATGVGWMLGVGRIGSIAGPLLGGVALGAGATPQTILSLSALPMLACAVAVALLGLTISRVAFVRSVESSS